MGDANWHQPEHDARVGSFVHLGGEEERVTPQPVLHGVLETLLLVAEEKVVAELGRRSLDLLGERKRHRLIGLRGGRLGRRLLRFLQIILVSLVQLRLALEKNGG